MTTRSCGSSTVSHTASRRRSSRLASLCRIACSSSPWISVPQAIPASARRAGVTAVRTCVGSSGIASIGRAIFAMCRASAVTDVIDHVAARARPCADSRWTVRVGARRRRDLRRSDGRHGNASLAQAARAHRRGTGQTSPMDAVARLRPAPHDEQLAGAGGRDVAKAHFLGIEVLRLLLDLLVPAGRLREHSARPLPSFSMPEPPPRAVRMALNPLRDMAPPIATRIRQEHHLGPRAPSPCAGS